MIRNDSIAELILAVGRPAFPERLVAAAGATVPHDAAALMILHPAAPPAVLVDRLKPAERSYLYGDYLSGVYTLSPFYRAAQKLKGPRVDRIMDIAPKGFTQSEYYRRYFALIGVDDMIGLLIPASDSETVFMSFSRSSGSPRFTAAEARSVAAPIGLFSAAVTRHTEIAGPLASRHIASAAASPAADKAQPSGLTQREAQVVNLMLEGHSSRAIGEVLKISGETVRVHRRNIYEKLGVSSQAELFRWFLSRQA
ncbi:LuxR C-terminal-related transcriptional regulator [Aestuariivirga sp.]|uniref:helix-turn-helix transcriptional regulator n=1 Tax=Aestuariivirga sp. TaxID=2650926 RepID=UPI003594400B